MLLKLQESLRAYATQERKKSNERFFKSGPGEYGAGDIFLGVSVPQSRLVAQQFKDLSLSECEQLLKSKFHEERLCALHILVNRYKKTKSFSERKLLYDFYIKQVSGINNWDLVDTSAPYIVGAYCFETQNYDILNRWILDTNLWKRRIAIVATQYLIRNSFYEPTLVLVENVLHDKNDLIHKAAGWMLREVGNRDGLLLREFLDKHHTTMPRTMLRYAIEKFEESERQKYLKKSIL